MSRSSRRSAVASAETAESRCSRSPLIRFCTSAMPDSRTRPNWAGSTANSRVTSGRVTRNTTPIAVWRPIRAASVSDSPSSTLRSLLSGSGAGTYRSQMTEVTPPSAPAHQVSTKQKLIV
jgi:hypothetical protein